MRNQRRLSVVRWMGSGRMGVFASTFHPSADLLGACSRKPLLLLFFSHWLAYPRHLSDGHAQRYWSVLQIRQRLPRQSPVGTAELLGTTASLCCTCTGLAIHYFRVLRPCLRQKLGGRQEHDQLEWTSSDIFGQYFNSICKGHLPTCQKSHRAAMARCDYRAPDHRRGGFLRSNLRLHGQQHANESHPVAESETLVDLSSPQWRGQEQMSRSCRRHGQDGGDRPCCLDCARRKFVCSPSVFVL